MKSNPEAKGEMFKSKNKTNFKSLKSLLSDESFFLVALFVVSSLQTHEHGTTGSELTFFGKLFNLTSRIKASEDIVGFVVSAIFDSEKHQFIAKIAWQPIFNIFFTFSSFFNNFF